MNVYDMDAVLLARIQFAFAISFHIIFPAFTIGLASWLVVVEGLWLKTKQPVYKSLYHFWVKIFAITFAMGVVSGIVMSYQFGLNWSGFSEKIGNVLGPLLGFEVLTAFFLESSFLGIMLFGWNRVNAKMHFAATLIVAIGTLISAFWILSANSWMQTPSGHELKDGIFYPLDWWKIVFNPSFPYRLFHMVTAAYLTTAFTVGGVAAWYLWRKEHIAQAKIMLLMAMIMALFVTPIQILFGDAHGLNTLKYQPMKVAAMEGLWETQTGAPMVLFAWPDLKNEQNLYSIEIPKISSLILTHSLDGEVKGLKEVSAKERPPVRVVFFAFRIMVGIGILMALTGLISLWLFIKKRLYISRFFQCWCMCMTPSGFIAVLSGWFVSEVGRQPYIVYGLMNTIDARSPVAAEYVLMSLLAYIIVYTFVFGAGIFYILKLIQKGPTKIDIEKTDTGAQIQPMLLLSDLYNTPKGTT